MAKRIIAGILGTLAVLASVLPVCYAFEVFTEVRNPDVSLWVNVLAGLIMSSIAITGIWIGIRFLRFAFSGRDVGGNGWAEPVLLGIGSFLPGFIFSFAVAALCVSRIWPSDDRRIDVALGASGCIGGIGAAILCTVLLLRKRARRRAHMLTGFGDDGQNRRVAG
jgi:hypothetical protein